MRQVGTQQNRTFDISGGDATHTGRMRNEGDGRFRKIRADAHIGNVATLQQKAGDVIERLGARTTVGELRVAFGGRDVGEIAALPKHVRALHVERYLQKLGLGNQAAKAAMTAALFGKLGERVISGKSYDVQINGQKYDREILKGFVQATAGPDRITSAAEMRTGIIPAFEDGGVLTDKELKSVMFGLRHFPTTGKAVRDELVPALRGMTGAPVKQLEDGQVGFDFMQLYDYMETSGRFADLYAAKADMSDADLVNMWDNGISVEQLNQHLENALKPASEETLAGKFGSAAMSEVKDWLRDRGDQATIQRIEGGQVSPGELQNLIYGSWQIPNTPYDPDYKAEFHAVPTKLRVERPNPEKVMDQFLGKVEQSIQQHDWAGLMKLIDPANRDIQRQIGVTSDAQYLKEAIGFHMVNNRLPGEVTSFDGLDQIADVSLSREAQGYGRFSGTATLANGEQRQVNIYVEQTPRGPVISPAVG